MQVEKVESWDKPLPDPDATERPFYAAAARGELTYQECPGCGHRQFPPRALCTQCGANPVWASASGRGRVYTWTVILQYHAPPFREELPYVIAIVELDEGVKMFGTLTGCAPEAVRIGMAVETYAVEAEEGVGILFWRPA